MLDEICWQFRFEPAKWISEKHIIKVYVGTDGWRVVGINRDDIYGRLRYLPEMPKFFDEVCETQEKWIRRRYTEIALEKKKGGGKEFTYDNVKRKVQIRRGFYERNRKLIETLIT